MMNLSYASVQLFIIPIYSYIHIRSEPTITFYCKHDAYLEEERISISAFCFGIAMEEKKNAKHLDKDYKKIKRV